MKKVRLTKFEKGIIGDYLPQLNKWYSVWEELQKGEAIISRDDAKVISECLAKALQRLKKSLGDEWRYNDEYKLIDGLLWKFKV